MNNQKQMLDRGITASAIKNVSMTYVPRDMSLCLFLSRSGCSKLLTIDNKCRGPVLSLQPFPARSSGTAPRPCFAALSRVQRTCADLPQNQADSRCRPNAATLSAVHKKVQGVRRSRSGTEALARTEFFRQR